MRLNLTHKAGEASAHGCVAPRGWARTSPTPSPDPLPVLQLCPHDPSTTLHPKPPAAPNFLEGQAGWSLAWLIPTTSCWAWPGIATLQPLVPSKFSRDNDSSRIRHSSSGLPGRHHLEGNIHGMWRRNGAPEGSGPPDGLGEVLSHGGQPLPMLSERPVFSMTFAMALLRSNTL